MKTTLTFHGGAEEVTGANFLLDTGTARILVDCGTAENHVGDTPPAPFAYDTKAISALFVTHAHQDHIGRIPELVRHGFRGTIYSTEATRDLAAVMLDDACGILQMEAERKGLPVPYEREDIARALTLWEVRSYRSAFAVGDLTIELLDAGHILGSAMIKISRDGRAILFTGDLGNIPEPLLEDTDSPVGVQYVVMESVYGDRVHEQLGDRKQRLRTALEDTRTRKGTLLIPSFSLERTQVLLCEINDMIEHDGMSGIPVYLDSPLATRVTEVFRKHTGLLNAATREKIAKGDDPFEFPGLTITDSSRASLAIHREPGPKVIIAGAGMSSGGRIRGHEKELLDDENTTLLFAGYQAAGSLGRRILEGAQKVRIDDTWIRVRARIDSLTGYSGHADRDGLLDFLEAAAPTLTRAFITMGESKSSIFLAQRAKDFLGIDPYVPKKGESVEIDL